MRGFSDKIAKCYAKVYCPSFAIPSFVTNEGADSRRRLRHAAATAHAVVPEAFGGVLQQVNRDASDRGARGGTKRHVRLHLLILTSSWQ